MYPLVPIYTLMSRDIVDVTTAKTYPPNKSQHASRPLVTVKLNFITISTVSYAHLFHEMAISSIVIEYAIL